MALYIFVPSLLLSMFLVMGALIILDANQLDVERSRANLLQGSLDNLRARSDQDVKFFELVRQLITTTNVAQKESLVNQLKNFKFSEPTTTVPKTSSKAKTTSAPGTTSTTRPKPRSPPTTARPPPRSTTTTTRPTCLTLPVTRVSICR